MRVVLDANIWVSASINPHGFPARLQTMLLQGKLETVVSFELIEEVIGVLTRPRIKDKYSLTLDDIELVRRVIEQTSIIEKPLDTGIKTRDPKDDYLIGLAIAGRAEYIVTGDRDLVDNADIDTLLDTHGIRVVKIRDFIEMIEANNRV